MLFKLGYLKAGIVVHFDINDVLRTNAGNSCLYTTQKEYRNFYDALLYLLL